MSSSSNQVRSNSRTLLTDDQRQESFFNYDIHGMYVQDLIPKDRSLQSPSNFKIETRFIPNNSTKSLLLNNREPTAGYNTTLSLGIDVSDVNPQIGNYCPSIYSNIATQEFVMMGREHLKKLVCAVYVTTNKNNSYVILMPYALTYPLRLYPPTDNSAVAKYWPKNFSEFYERFAVFGLYVAGQKDSQEVTAIGVGSLPNHPFIDQMLEALIQPYDGKRVYQNWNCFQNVFHGSWLGELYCRYIFGDGNVGPLAFPASFLQRDTHFIATRTNPIYSSVLAIDMTELTDWDGTFKVPSTFTQGLVQSIFSPHQHPIAWQYVASEKNRGTIDMANILPPVFQGTPFFTPRLKEEFNQNVLGVLQEACDTLVVEIVGAANQLLNDQTTSFTSVFKVNVDLLGQTRVEKMGQKGYPQLMNNFNFDSPLHLEIKCQNKHGDAYPFGTRQNWITIKLIAYRASYTNLNY